MKIIKKQYKKQLEINEIYKKAKENNIWNIFQAYKSPSYQKIRLFDDITYICREALNSYDWYIIDYNSRSFSMICKYKGKNKTYIRYWTPYNTYDCEVIEWNTMT